MNKIKSASRSTVEFVNKHRFAIGVAVGLSAGLSLVVRNQRMINEFLEEHDLIEEFYFIPEDHG